MYSVISIVPFAVLVQTCIIISIKCLYLQSLGNAGTGMFLPPKKKKKNLGKEVMESCEKLAADNQGQSNPSLIPSVIRVMDRLGMIHRGFALIPAAHSAGFPPCT